MDAKKEALLKEFERNPVLMFFASHLPVEFAEQPGEHRFKYYSGMAKIAFLAWPIFASIGFLLHVAWPVVVLPLIVGVRWWNGKWRKYLAPRTDKQRAQQQMLEQLKRLEAFPPFRFCIDGLPDNYRDQKALVRYRYVRGLMAICMMSFGACILMLDVGVFALAVPIPIVAIAEWQRRWTAYLNSAKE